MRAPLAVLLTLVVVSPATAQAPGRISASAGFGPGIQFGSNKYQSVLAFTGHLGIAVGIAGGLAIEIEAEQTLTKQDFGDDLLLSPDGSTPAHGYHSFGGHLSAILTPVAGLRLAAGAGVYRVSADGGFRNLSAGERWPDLTRSAFHLGIEKSIISSERMAFYGGIRAVYFPNLRDDSAVFLPMEFGLRLR